MRIWIWTVLMVDIAVRMQKFTDKKLSPAEFKKIRTVNDVVEAVYGLLG